VGVNLSIAYFNIYFEGVNYNQTVEMIKSRSSPGFLEVFNFDQTLNDQVSHGSATSSYYSIHICMLSLSTDPPSRI
jgi:hypothetical protein